MNITFINGIPKWDGTQGNWNAGRVYYRKGPKFGTKAKVNKIIIHWMDGTLASTDSTFKKASRKACAHFGVEDGNIHQYVAIQDTSYNSGNGDINVESIGIEHSAQPGRDATDATYESSSQLIVQIAHSLGLRVSDLQFLAHRDIVATECCGTVSVERIRNRALELESLALNGVPNVQITETIAHVDAPVSPEALTFAPFNQDLRPSQIKNAEVKRMQEYLIAFNLMEDQGNNDGIYGTITQHAVNAFQRLNGLQSDQAHFGWWWTKTREAANHQLTITKTNNA